MPEILACKLIPYPRERDMNYETDPELLALLEQAKQLPPMTATQIKAQQRSWVIAEMGMGSDTDELAYRVALALGDAAKLNRLNAEGAYRMSRATMIFDAGLLRLKP